MGRVLYPSITTDGKTIAFERDFGVWTVDVASGNAKALPIALRGAIASASDEHLVLTNGFQEMALSPDGKKVAFIARGEVFATSAADGGDAVRVTRTPSIESQLAWAPDSRRLTYASNRDGAWHVFYMISRKTRRRSSHADRRPTCRLAGRPTERSSRSCAMRASCMCSTSPPVASVRWRAAHSRVRRSRNGRRKHRLVAGRQVHRLPLGGAQS
jgi:hypothetical protein